MSNIFNKFIFYLFALGPFVAFVTTKFWDMNFYNVMTAFVYFAFILQYAEITGQHKKYNFPKYAIYLLLFIIYTIISDIILAGKSINIKYFYTNRLMPGLLILLIVENAVITKKFIKPFLRVNIIIIIIAFIVIMYQQLVDNTFFVDLTNNSAVSFIFNQKSYNTRPPSIYSWIGMLEISFGFVSIVSVVISIDFLKKKKITIILFWLLLANLYSFISKSRYTMINTLILFAMYPIYIKTKLNSYIKYVIVSGFLLYGGLILLNNYGIPVLKVIQDRILEENTGGFATGTAGSRIVSAIVFLKLYPEHPIFGKGYLHTFDKYTNKDTELTRELAGRSSQIHIGYLSLLYYYGFIGAIIFILFLYHLMKKLKREAKESHFWGAFFAFLGFVLANFTLVTFTVFWSGLIVSLIFHKYYFIENSEKQLSTANENKIL